MAENKNIPATPHVSWRKRALVLGGGGSAGNAWEIGIVAGLLDAGLAVTDADLIIGTSAGATVAAQITGATPTDLLADILSAAAPQSRPAAPAPQGPVSDHLDRTGRIIAAASDAADMRRRMGAASLALDDGSGSARWRAIVAPRLPSPDWPEQTVLITAIDALTGEPVVFNRDSGVDLVDAVAASTSASVPYRIKNTRYLDGGYRRNENADLAAGYGRVLVLSPFGGRSRHPDAWGMQLSAQVDELRAGGSRVETVFPDAAALEAFGANMMDLSARPPSARAGYDHGRTVAEQLISFWC
jgi:NTE family protein